MSLPRELAAALKRIDRIDHKLLTETAKRDQQITMLRNRVAVLEQHLRVEATGWELGSSLHIPRRPPMLDGLQRKSIPRS